jgi:RNA polymerase sigma-70 factor (ECF subfamily)
MDSQADFLTRFLHSEAEIRAFVGSVVRDVHAREDLVQEIAITLWRRFDSYDPERPFGAWARGIAAKKLMECRTQSQRTPVPFSPAAIQMIVEAAERAETSPTLSLEALEHCIGGLPDEYRRLLALRYTQGRSVDSIAAELNRTADSIYQALSRLRRRLRDCMQRRLATQEEEECLMNSAPSN